MMYLSLGPGPSDRFLRLFHDDLLAVLDIHTLIGLDIQLAALQVAKIMGSEPHDQHDQLSFDDLLLAILDVDAVGRDVLYPLAAEIIGGVIS